MPADAYYGVQTQRAVENFPISGMTAPPELVTATVQIKKAAAEAECRARPARLGRSPRPSSRAADEMLAGGLRDQFVVDVYQAGAGTSHNMNTNEVLANRAAEILGRAARRLLARAPERSRQHGPVDQRRLPDRDPSGAAGDDSRLPVEAARTLAERAVGKGAANSTAS